MAEEKPVRKHPVHGLVFFECRPTIVFDTVCTKGRKRWLATDEVHQLLRQVWQEATAWLVGRYMVLPEHIHYFATATDPEVDYEHWVQYWKSQFSKRHGIPGHRWQTDHWDTRMRTAQQYEDKWEYVRWNPVRHGLVAKPEDWPYQGEIFRFTWDGDW